MMKASKADLKICLAAWEKHLEDSARQRELLKGKSVSFGQLVVRTDDIDEEAKQLEVHIGDLYALDVHSLDLLKSIFPEDSDLICKWPISEGNPPLKWHVDAAAYKVGALKLALDILERQDPN